MIPSDHFVRYYNEVFKALDGLGRSNLVQYWHELGKIQIRELGEQFRQGGLEAADKYWSRIKEEENCVGELILTEDYFEFRMDRCPSLSKVLDNDAEPCELYCDHCMGWIKPLMDEAGLFAVCDMVSRSEPRCVFRVYKDSEKADAFLARARLPGRPYAEHGNE
ncbi:MAG: hypothetical protein ACLFWL_11460 [Candidatus Brocadiia bacterium]